MASFQVYKVRYPIAIPDPEMPTPRYHIVLFVRHGTLSSSPFSGTVHHVTGDITTGMTYTTRSFDPAEKHHSRELIGLIKEVDYPDGMNDVLRAQPPPPKQKHFNIRTMKTEQMKPGGRFYEIGEQRPRMVKCTEWIEEQAIPALWESGVLRKWESN